MKKFDKHLKTALVCLAVFILFLMVFWVLSSLVQTEILPDFTANQRVQGVLVFIMFSPLCTALFFLGIHFRSKNNVVFYILTFVSIALFVFGIVQAVLSALGAYGI